MKRLIPIFLSLLAAFTCMGMLCDTASHNGPTNYTPFDTTAVKHLDTAALVNIRVFVEQYDKQTTSLQPSVKASVHFINSDTIILTDSTGYARATFAIDSIPFKYSYEVNKDGYRKRSYNGWDKEVVIFDEIILYENK